MIVLKGKYNTAKLFTDNIEQESPFAYKPMDEIIANIADTVEIVKIIKPV